MINEHGHSTPATVQISYPMIAELAAFQEQYERLTNEIQQVRIQLESSPALEPGTAGAAKREEWRSWLSLQIKSKQHARTELVRRLHDKGIEVDALPQ